MDLPKDLTKRQQEIFEFIKKYSAKYGYPPTVRDIGKAVGLASSSTVHAHLANLEKVGLLRRDRSEEHTSELQSRQYLVCRLLLEKKNINIIDTELVSLHASVCH